MAEFVRLSDAEAAEVKAGGRRKEWFDAIRAGAVIRMTKRPSLTSADKEMLDGEGMRMRTRYAGEGDDVFVWLEEQSPDRPHLVVDDAPLDDDEVPL